MKKLNITALFILLIFSIVVIQKITTSDPELKKNFKTSGAGMSMDLWFFERAYPSDNIPVSKFTQAFNEKRQMEAQRGRTLPGEWESLGPQNIGGRTLALAFHPTNADIIYAGSASGGLWKTTTRGVGQNAWQPIETGFPVLGVASIVIDNNNSDIIYIGTGETYGVGFAEPGTINRRTRGTYGIGILKTTDAGDTWVQVLPFDVTEIKGVQDIEISPQNSQHIFAATTDGVYRSLDGGENWSLVFNELNCIDIEIDPTNTGILYVSQGNFNFNLDPTLSGIFKSVDNGSSFNELLHPGLINAWSGNAKLTLDPSNSDIIYASIQVGTFNTDPTTPAGVFKSTDAGATWDNINNQNIAQFQGWYSHDIAINPTNPSEVINVGIDTWKSTDFGANFVKKSNWQAWQFGEISIEVPEGGPNYVHADIHAVYYHPLVADQVFYATDGGIFSSNDGGETFETHNGGLQTGQFYANMASSATNPDYCIAGAQDNATYIYRGQPSWFRVIGGDGMSASVRQDDDQIVFASAQNLEILKSTNGGLSFFNAKPTLVNGDFVAFSAPYEIAPSNNDVMYAGSRLIYKSIDGAATWNATVNQPIDGVSVVVKIAVSPSNHDEIYVATSPIPLTPTSGTVPAKMFKSTDGGTTFAQLTGLPDRICKDIEIDPLNSNIIYALYSGFGTDHVFRSTDGGANWNAIDGNLPDLPANTIAIDPLNTDNLYVGNDLGVYFSENSGNTWEPFSDALPEATLVMDLNISPSNRKNENCYTWEWNL